MIVCSTGFFKLLRSHPLIFVLYRVTTNSVGKSWEMEFSRLILKIRKTNCFKMFQKHIFIISWSKMYYIQRYVIHTLHLTAKICFPLMAEFWVYLFDLWKKLKRNILILWMLASSTNWMGRTVGALSITYPARWRGCDLFFNHSLLI